MLASVSSDASLEQSGFGFGFGFGFESRLMIGAAVIILFAVFGLMLGRFHHPGWCWAMWSKDWISGSIGKNQTGQGWTLTATHAMKEEGAEGHDQKKRFSGGGNKGVGNGNDDNINTNNTSNDNNVNVTMMIGFGTLPFGKKKKNKKKKNKKKKRNNKSSNPNQNGNEEDWKTEMKVEDIAVNMAKSNGSQLLVVSDCGDVLIGHQSKQGLSISQALACERALHHVKIKSVACGPNHFAAISQDFGDLYTWGRGECGQLGHSSFENETFPRKVCALLAVNIVKVACGTHHTLALSDKGDLFSCGKGADGRLGHRETDDLGRPKRILTFSVWEENHSSSKETKRIVDISCGEDFSVALDDKGSVYCFGSSEKGQCAACLDQNHENPKTGIIICPKAVTSLQSQLDVEKNEKIVSVQCGLGFTIAASNLGKLYSWGCAPFGELGRVTSKPVDRVFPESGLFFRHVVCGERHVVAITKEGIVYGWGCNEDGQLGKQVACNDWEPRPLHKKEDVILKEGSSIVSCGSKFTLLFINTEANKLKGGNRQNLEESTNLNQSKSPRRKKRSRSKEALRSQLEVENVEHGKRLKWETKILPRWKEKRNSQYTTLIWKLGIPAPLRAVVWPLAIGNQLRITKSMYYAFKASPIVPKANDEDFEDDDVYDDDDDDDDDVGDVDNMHGEDDGKEMGTETETDEDEDEDEDDDGIKGFGHYREECVENAIARSFRALSLEREVPTSVIDADLPRTFPTLQLFQHDGPLGTRLRNVLKTFSSYRPDIGYLQGMSYLGGILVLNTENEYMAFKCLANLLVSHHLFAFYRLDPNVLYKYYDVLMKAVREHSPTRALADHLDELGVHPHLYVFLWFQTLYLKVLPLHIAVRVIDNFLLEGTSYIVKTAIALLVLFKERLLSLDSFESCVQLLTCSPGTLPMWNSDIHEKHKLLFTLIEEISLSSKLVRELDELSESCN